MARPGEGLDDPPPPPREDPPPDLPTPPQVIDPKTHEGQMPPAYNVEKPFVPDSREVRSPGSPKPFRRPTPPPAERRPSGAE